MIFFTSRNKAGLKILYQDRLPTRIPVKPVAAITAALEDDISDMLRNMRYLVLSAAVIASSLLAPTQSAAADSGTAYLSAIEARILREMNLARSKPAGYAELLAERRKYFKETRFKQPREGAIETQEGVAALDDAIEYLKQVGPAAALTPSPGISRAARDHVLDQGPSGGLGHQGKDGSRTADRVSRYGKWSGKLAENISYGQSDAREVVLQQIVDDGTPARDHRMNLLDPDFRIVGLACGRHEEYGVMCVTTFATDYEETAH